jgi:hypothetical protein
MKKDEGKEVEYKVKSGTAWSHSYLNQKPWHPLSYPNQRRKWIAEQQNAQRDRKAEEVSREVFPDFPSLFCLFLFYALVFWSFSELGLPFSCVFCDLLLDFQECGQVGKCF